MYTTAKYLIHADVRTNGVVERSDVVGAIFGQTEGLLGDQLDLRDLQESSKVGRIDVDVDSEGGRSFGTITIASGLDRVETAVLAAALETIERVGPCRAECTITHIEDAREAKRRELIDRATMLLSDLEETTVTSEQIVEAVRQQARVEEITDYRGLPAGPRVERSDAIIVVEGRADVRRLLKYGIKNAVAVEGTDIPDEVAELTFERNTTAFLDGDRGGDLILRELQQVGDVDYIAFAPTGGSVEDLDRREILSALRRKVPLEQITDGQTPRKVFAPADTGELEQDEQTADTDQESSETPSLESEDVTNDEVVSVPDEETVSVEVAAGETTTESETEDHVVESIETSQGLSETEPEDTVELSDGPQSGAVAEDVTLPDEVEDEEAEAVADAEPVTLPGHVEAVISGGRETVRLLDDSFEVIEENDFMDAFETVAETEPVPDTIILDGTLSQRLLDVAAQRGVGQIVAADTGEFVKQPTNVRVRNAADFEIEASS